MVASFCIVVKFSRARSLFRKEELIRESLNSDVFEIKIAFGSIALSNPQGEYYNNPQKLGTSVFLNAH